MGPNLRSPLVSSKLRTTWCGGRANLWVTESSAPTSGIGRVDLHIRIVKRPDGEAPEEVRDAWIGLLLPVLPRFSRMVARRGVGVHSGPRSYLGMWFAALVGRGKPMRGYVV